MRDAKQPERPSHRIAPLLGVFSLAVACSGCLSTSYIIPESELQRLVNRPAAARGQRLHVVQRFITNTDPPPAPAMRVTAPLPPPGDPSNVGPVPVSPWGNYYPSFGNRTFAPWRPVLVTRSNGAASSTAAATTAPISGPDGGVIRAGGGLAKALAGTSVDDAKAAAAVAVIAGLGLGIGLAVTEGIRWDGYVAVHPDHPVHLMGPRGSYRLTSLSKLHLANPQHDEEAVVMRHEGIGMWELARAPLSRRGLTYEMEFGQRELPIGDGQLLGATTADFMLGAFTTDYWGFLVGVSLSFGNDLGADVFGFAPRIELQWHPLTLGYVHLGLFGGASLEDVDIEELVDGFANVRTLSSPVVEGGAMLQLEITTRLAINFRWSVANWLSGHEGTLPSRFTIGMSVY